MATVQDIYELSPMQQGMLFHTLYAPESSVYFEQRSCLLEGNLGVDAFKQAWQAVVERHAVLRTAFYWEEADKPLQVVHERAELPWIEGDWQSLLEAEQAQRLEAFLQDDRAKGFQLNQAPLMRCALFKIGPVRHRFVWSHHHLLMDGWCNAMLIKEVMAFYTAQRQGQSLTLQLPRPYRDYILWLQQQDQQQSEAYWRTNLAGFKAPTPLGIERSQIAESVSQSEHHDQCRTLSQSLTAQLNTFAKQRQMTLNTLVQGAWALLLSRYSSLPDVLFGATVSGRPPTLLGADSIVGLFINTVPVRVAVSPDMPLLLWLQQLQDTQRDRETYAYTALTDIQSWSEVPSGTPLFESLIVFENYPVSLDSALTDTSSGLTILEGQGFEQTNYPLVLVVIPGNSLSFRVNYASDRFPSPAIQRLISHLETLLKGMIVNPNQPLAALPMLSEAERYQLEADWNQTEQTIPAYCVHELIAAQAKERPEATALIFQDTALTYSDLDSRANQLAHALKAQGVEPGQRIAVCLERSADLVITLLAILNVGGVYVPLDPTYPAERRRFILADAEVSLLVTATADAVGIAPPTTVPVLDLERHGSQITPHSLTPPPPHPLTPTDLAYLIYTSGSTGSPKGVPIRHQSLTNLLTAMAQAPGMSAQDTLLAVTTPAFDIAALELFLPLTVGGALVIASQDTVRDPQRLSAQLAQHDVTLMQATPATWRLLIESGWQGKSNLTLLCGGEPLDLSLAQSLLECGSALWNLYGPTETTIWSAALRLEASMLQDGIVPIGPPIANTQFYVFDGQQRPVPVGVRGELHIGGLGLSPGYWQRDELTAERFMANPLLDGRRQNACPSTLSASPHPRVPASSLLPPTLYKTGDLVRYREDGTLQYLGRLDYQVKLRGFRIELGEIEAVLTQHPEVTQAVVVLRKDAQAEPQLVAYVVLTPTAKVQPPPFREHLTQRLPAYMTPSLFVILDALPLTPNGKVDRNALPAPDSTETLNLSTSPLTPTEELLATIWSAVLGQSEIAREHNFFELGGHSLLATRVAARVRQTFGVELPLRSLFEQPTIAQLATVVEALKRGHSSLDVQPIEPVERSAPLPLSDAQQRQWVLAQLEPESPFYSIPMAVRVKGPLSLDWLQQSLEQVVERHEVLRSAFKAVEGQAQLEIHPTVELSIALTDFRGLDAARQRHQVREHLQRAARTPFDLSQAPLLRMQVMRLAEDEHVVLLSLHHIITDGGSMGILVRELAQVYDALHNGQPVTLPPLPIQYVDYAAWQQQQSKQYHQQLGYWKRQLQGAPPLLELPTDYPRPAVQSFEGATYEFRLSADRTEALHQLSQQQGVTLFMTLLAVFQVVLYRYSGIEDVVIGTPIANRPRPELEGLIGMFVNTLVLRTDMSGNPRVEELLGRVREMALEAYAHQSVPFEQVVDALAVPRSWSHSPLFQVMCVLQTAPMEAMALDSALEWQPLPLESGATKVDLTLSMRLEERGLKGALEYRTDLFTADTIHRLAGHLCQLLKVIPQQPTRRIAELPMVLKSEHKQLWQWNQTQADYPRNLCIHQLFEQQVAKTPNAIALVCGQQKLSYQELNARANQLAHFLNARGIGSETLVGICMERTADMVVALLAILKAGGAYIPLDPAYPEERLAFILQDAQASLILTSKLLSVTVPESIPLIAVDDLWETTLSELPKTNPVIGATANHLAYVIYTSGSTGKPKGVAIEHHSPVALSHWAKDVFAADQLSGVLAGTSLCFDLSVFEIFVPLSWGGAAILAENALQLPLLNAANEVTLVNTVPSVAAALLRINGFPPNVTTINLAGEPLPPTLAQQLYQTSHIQHVFNLYGPSEDTTYSTYARMEPEATLSPIGYPIANTQVHVLDANLQPVPIGVPGELYLSSAGVARGYLNRPDLTAERFVPNPFWEGRRQKAEGRRGREQRIGNREQRFEFTPNSKLQTPKFSSHPPIPPSSLYKTGDRVRHLPNGALEFLGRLDNQVKIRGFRIELGEVEAALLSHPLIEQAAVNPWTDNAGNQRLAAYVVFKAEGGRQKAEGKRKVEEAGNREQGTGNRSDGVMELGIDGVTPSPHHPITPSPITPSSPLSTSPRPHVPLSSPNPPLHQYLATQLPDYMLPAVFMELDELPCLPNGKLDRRALPIPECLEQTGETIAPTTEIEGQLATIWSELLPVEQVGIHDNFFELGGDSILALQAIAKAHQIGLQFTPRDLFQHQTIARLAATVSSREDVQAEQGMITGPVLLTPIQHWFFEQGLSHPHHWNQAILLGVKKSLSPVLLEQALELLAAHHDALRATFTPSEAGWRQYWQEPHKMPLTVLTGAESEFTAALAKVTHDLQTGFDLATGPLLRVAYLDFGSDHRRLLLVSHHLVVDGLSWRILLEDLRATYEQLERHNVANLPPKTTSFKQWAEHLQTYGNSEALQTERAYWQEAATFPRVSLPRDFASQDNRMAIANTVTVNLGEGDTRRLLKEVPNVYRSQINDLLLTALVLAFEPWTGARRLCLELESHGREELPNQPAAGVNLSRTVGWFTALFPVGLDLTDAQTLGAALKQVKETLRSVPNRGLGYGLLRYLYPEPLQPFAAEVRFNYLGQVDQVFWTHDWFAPALESSGVARSPHDQRTTLIEIDGLVSRGQLHLNWTYSTAIHDRTTIANLANGFLDSLGRLIDYCVTTDEDSGYTPSDFPHMTLSQGELDDLLAEL